MVCASEVGAVYIAPETVIQKGRLKPGRMLLVDTEDGRIVDDKELKRATARKQDFASNDPKLLTSGFTLEQLHLLMLPMFANGKEPLGSMGNDAPLAAHSYKYKDIYVYRCSKTYSSRRKCG
ncbi:uncharacterized protein BXZ73DRAFT_95482 [Epithele typhae]|uniref:uncharacterized protein n=1 Tax=Epithele typhae TaxID=378194 RepID=UPI0020076806|nr:uncharacterized protein BXZ73DRAFT_95482 [Epithele typhae]KAH9945966.1 hypothetical protein BXZ73DRAFT_95482 [Epithele typhae]